MTRLAQRAATILAAALLITATNVASAQQSQILLFEDNYIIIGNLVLLKLIKINKNQCLV